MIMVNKSSRSKSSTNSTTFGTKSTRNGQFFTKSTGKSIVFNPVSEIAKILAEKPFMGMENPETPQPVKHRRIATRFKKRLSSAAPKTKPMLLPIFTPAPYGGNFGSLGFNTAKA